AHVKQKINATICGESDRYVAEYRMRCKNGSWKWILARGKIIASSSSGKPSRILGTHSDITERKQLEETIKGTNTFLENIFTVTPDIIMATDSKGCISYLNDSIQAILGYHPEELLGKRPAALAHTDEQYEALHEIKTRLLLHEGAVKSYEINLQHKKGNLCPLEIYAIALRDNNGSVYGSISFLRDISERKKTEQMLRQTQKMEAIGTMAGGISHDFNNILAIILGNADLALDPLPDEHPARYNINQIAKAAGRARDLVKQILSFSRHSQYDKKVLRLRPLITEALKMLRSMIPSSISIRHDLNCPIDMISADATQIHQVIMNLCTNAYQAMEISGGTLTVALTNITVDETNMAHHHNIRPGSYVQLTVRDTGDGIEPKNLSKIFDPFFTTKGLEKGTGLGLAVAYGIVKQHGGDISVESRPGRGTTIQVIFPSTVQEITEDAARRHQPAPTGTERILVVDDEHPVANMMQLTLEHLGYQVTVETDSVRALDRIRKNTAAYDLIITDQTMPRMTGTTLIRKIKQLSPLTPVILSTGYSSMLDSQT
ncbi:MAG: PAS domain S-box protein, partial [Deltaproteobacteria bacterium]|nr:PAS domain S-box protein [Deltaproteobacteria bacterium]